VFGVYTLAFITAFGGGVIYPLFVGRYSTIDAVESRILVRRYAFVFNISLLYSSYLDKTCQAMASIRCIRACCLLNSRCFACIILLST
jgi:uncharacterized membrane protein YeiH